MFAKSTITLFVLAVGLSSLLNGNGIGSASAYPRPDRRIMRLNLNDPNDLKAFQHREDPRTKNVYRADTILYNNSVQGSKTTSENHWGSEADQKDIMVIGKLPEDGSIYGARTYAEGNAIQLSDSSGKNFMASRVYQRNITYNVKD